MIKTQARSRRIRAALCRVRRSEIKNPAKCAANARVRSSASLRLAFHNEGSSLAAVCNWIDEFKRSRTDLTDGLREGRPSTATSEDYIICTSLCSS
ncbi:hypothetical protein EVAR_30666_1 [Eumeta japonica]|uniref:Uncharacterized protein n=1 Tax=Eumeta variegata TaxID=151549 RepID=A0A4C1VQ27_EUMVA|nr:hypothetical protein EVAR_30666_1 [Eumeta japonica]